METIDEEKLNSLADSQRLILEQQYYALSQIYQDNDTLDGKVAGLLQLTSLIFMTLVIIHLINNMHLGIIFIPIVLMTILMITWIPRKTFSPGTRDWNTLHAGYINQDSQARFEQILDDCMETNDRLLSINSFKALLVKISTVLFGIQMIVIAIMVW